MDPITLASKRFQSEVRLFWEPPPGHEIVPRVLRVAVEYSHRKEALKSLRLLEWAPENRRPFVIVEGSFVTRDQYVALIDKRVREDYAKLAKGLAGDGVTIAALPPPEVSPTAASVRRVLQAASESVLVALEGIVVALMPERIADEAAFASVIAELAPASNGAALRLAVQDAPPLAGKVPGVASFVVDEDALLEHLKSLGKSEPDAPPPREPRMTPAQKAAAESALGKSFASQTTGMELRALLLDAGQAMSKGQFKIAAKKFRAARMLCRVAGLVEEEAATSIATGSAVLAAGDRMGAIAAFRHGRDLALAKGNKVLAAQAMFGAAGALFFAADYRNAGAHYGEVAKLTEELPALHLEALRMQGECLLKDARPAEAIAAFGHVVDAAATLPDDQRKTTSYALAGATLAQVLDKNGQAARARATERRIAELADESAASPEVGR